MDSSAAHSPDAIQKQKKIYISVFAALACLTIITVAISYLHLPALPAIALALFVAAIKATLVAAFFMHLISEKQIISAILILTGFFFLVVLILPGIS